MINHSLLEILRCPLCSEAGLLDIYAQKEVNLPVQAGCDRWLKCRKCENVYPIIQGIPDMLVRNSNDRYVETEIIQWDKQAAVYDDKRKYDAIYLAGVDSAVEALAPKAGDFVLDAACGSGLTIRKYHHPNIRIIAFDISLESLFFLQNTLGSNSIDFVRGDLNALPFCENIFDKVLCANAIQHIPNEISRQNCIKGLAKIAKSNSRIVVTTHNFSFPKKRAGWAKEKRIAGSHSGNIQYIYRYEKEEFCKLLASSLVVDKLIGAGLPLPYKFKMSPVSHRIERLLRRFGVSAFWGHMLVGICHKR